jgi:Family of unknown function (DUF6010)
MQMFPILAVRPTPLSELTAVDWVTPVLPALIWMTALSFAPEPSRRKFNAIFVGGAGAAYLGGGFGLWELAFTAAATWVAYKGLESYRAIGLAWVMHSAWDLAHHLWGNTILPTIATSSIGCAVCDAVLAIWFFAGAPSLVPALRRLWSP